MRVPVAVCFFAFFVCLCAQAVIDPLSSAAFRASEPVFDTGGYAVIRITMDAREKEMLLNADTLIPRLFTHPSRAAENSMRQPWFLFTDVVYHCTMVFSNRFVNETVQDTAIGLRGNNSRRLPKKSVKLDFDYYNGAQLFREVKKLKLLAEFKDNSLMRAALTERLYRFMRQPCARASHCLLYINDELIGLFVMQDQEDSIFWETRFGSKADTMYNCRNMVEWPTWPPQPGALGTFSEANFVFRPHDDYIALGRQLVYQLGDDKHLPRRGYFPITNFINFLHAAADTQFVAEIEQRFNVEMFIRHLAIETLSGNGDNYRFRGNNFFIYEDPATLRLEFVPRDFSNVLGIDELGVHDISPSINMWDSRNPYRWLRRNTYARNWATRDINAWGPQTIEWGGLHRLFWGPLIKQKPLADRILAVPRYRRLYNQYIADLCASAFSYAWMECLATNMHAYLQPAVAAVVSEGNQRRGQKFSPAHYATALTKPPRYAKLNVINAFWGGFLTHGILPFVSNRVASAQQQLDPVICNLNEVLYRNTSGITNDIGTRAPWLELFNPAFQPVNL
ncbi:MAG: CotH kinase family protein, partial [bacterium]|nr:CotH kinase family protein [bacterium]